MDITRNHYKKFLVDEIMRASHATAKEAYEQVNKFSITREFNESFVKWLSIEKRKRFKPIGKPKSIKEVLGSMI